MVEYLRVFDHVGFFCFRWFGTVATTRDERNEQVQFNHGPTDRRSGTSLSSSGARATRRRSVTVVLSEDTLVITLHGALSPAEKALAQSPAGAAQVQEFHRQLFANSADVAAAGDQANHRRGGARGDAEVEPDDRHRGAGVHDRHRGAGVPARPQRSCGNAGAGVSRAISHETGGSAMLVLSRKSQESVVVGGSIG